MAQYSREGAPFYIKKAKWPFAKLSLSASSFHGLGTLVCLAVVCAVHMIHAAKLAIKAAEESVQAAQSINDARCLP